jgi:hypothetical protein
MRPKCIRSEGVTSASTSHGYCRRPAPGTMPLAENRMQESLWRPGICRSARYERNEGSCGSSSIVSDDIAPPTLPSCLENAKSRLKHRSVTSCRHHVVNAFQVEFKVK